MFAWCQVAGNITRPAGVRTNISRPSQRRLALPKQCCVNRIRTVNSRIFASSLTLRALARHTSHGASYRRAQGASTLRVFCGKLSHMDPPGGRLGGILEEPVGVEREL